MFLWEILLPDSRSSALFPRVLSHISLSMSNEISQQLINSNMLIGPEFKESSGGLGVDFISPMCVCPQGRLPVKWMAPEALFDRVYTHQSDV